MTYKVSWYQKDRIALIQIAGDYTVKEIAASAQKIVDEYLNKGVTPVHLIVDTQQMHSFPRNLPVIRTSIQPLASHNSLGWLISISTSNKVIKLLISMSTRMAGIHSHTVSTIEEAALVLYQVDPTLVATRMC